VMNRRWASVVVVLMVGMLGGCAWVQPGGEDAGSEAGAGKSESVAAKAEAGAAAVVPQWTFDASMIFPADHSLARPEDGVALPDGRVIVADQEHGLRVIEADGSHRPFGKFAEAGYEHEPPEIVGAPNGVTLEPAGTHLLVSDVYRGGIYRVEIATEAPELLYQHPFGVHMTRRDSRGGLWISQSTENPPKHGEEKLTEAVVSPRPDGALLYAPPAGEGEAVSPRPVVEGLLFGNGLVLDEAGGWLYQCESLAHRVNRYRIDLEKGTASERTTAVEIEFPDNIEMDRHGRLWIASFVRCEIIVFDPATGTKTTALRVSTPESEAQIAKIRARMEAGEPWIDLFTPELFLPGPGPITGMILSADGEQAIYATGLGNAMIRLGP